MRNVKIKNIEYITDLSTNTMNYINETAKEN